MSQDRKRGRPREWDSFVSVRLPVRLHDNVCLEALTRRVTVSRVIRERMAAKPFRITKDNLRADTP